MRIFPCIQENTKNTLLEAACWDASTIRKTAARVRQRTDASQRFEKYLDPALTSWLSKSGKLY